MPVNSLKIKKAEKEGTCGKMAASTKATSPRIARTAKAVWSILTADKYEALGKTTKWYNSKSTSLANSLKPKLSPASRCPNAGRRA